MAEDSIIKIGADLYIQRTILDTNGNGVTGSQTTTGSILNFNTQKWWNTGTSLFDIDVGSEPSLATLPHIRNGLYRLKLTGAGLQAKNSYEVHFKGITTVVFEFTVMETIGADSSTGTHADITTAPPLAPTTDQMVRHIYFSLARNAKELVKATGVETQFQDDGTTPAYTRTDTDNSVKTVKGKAV